MTRTLEPFEMQRYIAVYKCHCIFRLLNGECHGQSVNAIEV